MTYKALYGLTTPPPPLQPYLPSLPSTPHFFRIQTHSTSSSSSDVLCLRAFAHVIFSPGILLLCFFPSPSLLVFILQNLAPKMLSKEALLPSFQSPELFAVFFFSHIFPM